MEYRILGRTGIKVSTIGIGGEGFENKSDKVDEFKAMLPAALNFGVTPVEAKIVYQAVAYLESEGYSLPCRRRTMC
jgi:aryl-alcohol dehydrogenase-like predicted oxidoreductase